MAQDLKEMAKTQMKGAERFGKRTSMSSLERLLGPEEQVEELFGAQVNGKQAVLALTDRRRLASYGCSENPTVLTTLRSARSIQA